MRIQDGHIVRDATPEEEQALNYEEFTGEDALVRYANSITGANDPTLIEAAETLITERIKEES